MSKISLTASMRNNLLSLQNISRQVSLTQNRLATGQKVNSAIDNPSSFYTASSLNNRAKDLDNLLDAMSQTTSTIKAATTALETATTFLEQASAVATQALESAIPAKEYFEELVGENGAVVSTAQELKDAVAAGKETICVYGKIDYFENETVKLKDGQNLVGTEYFTGYTGKEKFSQINFRGNMTGAIYCNNGDFLISDIKIDYRDHDGSYPRSVLQATSANITINNVDASHHVPEEGAGRANSVITIRNSTGIFSGINNFMASGACADTLVTHNSHNNVSSDAVLNLDSGQTTRPCLAMRLYESSILDLYGKLNINSTSASICMGRDSEDYCSFNAYSEAHISIKAGTYLFITRAGSRVLNLQPDVSINVMDKYGNTAELISNGYALDNLTTTEYIYTNNLKDSGCFIEKEPSIDWDTWQAVEDKEKDTATEDASKQYSEILTQYDTLINDGSYKGVNLLKDDELKVNFNEKSTASLEVKGKDMSTNALGFATQNWTNQGDIAQSLKEISSALNSIRNYNAELGNNYSIITSRQDFTENLINILTEGADKLTLADMNEESANMLALQTRQQLAVNSLSLASQASQSVLKLF